MIYALCDLALSYGLEDGVMEFEDEAAAEEDFRALVQRLRPDGISERWLFRSREDAVAANERTTDEEVDVDDTMAFRTLDYERGFGFNF